jgi:hypothetical protein
MAHTAEVLLCLPSRLHPLPPSHHPTHSYALHRPTQHRWRKADLLMRTPSLLSVPGGVLSIHFIKTTTEGMSLGSSHRSTLLGSSHRRTLQCSLLPTLDSRQQMLGPLSFPVYGIYTTKASDIPAVFNPGLHGDSAPFRAAGIPLQS